MRTKLKPVKFEDDAFQRKNRKKHMSRGQRGVLTRERRNFTVVPPETPLKL